MGAGSTGAKRTGRSWRGGWAAFAVTLVSRQVLCLLLALVVVTLVPAAIGWRSTVVSSGSMEPRIRVGDIAVARPMSGMPLRLGHVVLVRDPDHAGRLRLHRFVGSTGDGRLITRGDRNAHADSSAVPMSDLVGIAVLRVPMIGMPAVWLGSGRIPEVLLTAAGLGALLAGAALFRADGDERGRPPEGRPFRTRLGRRVARRRFVKAGVAVVTVGTLVAGAGPGVGPASAAYSAQSGNTGSSFAATSRYRCADRVLGDGPLNYYKLAEGVGTTAADSSGYSHPGTYSATGISYGVTGPCSADGATAVTLDGGSTTGITTANAITRPAAFTAQLWIKSTTTTGGTLFGVFDSVTGSSGSRDPIVYMNNAGQVTLRMFNPTNWAGIGLTSPAAYNDNAWHLVAASFGSGTATLSVDGSAVASGSINWSNPTTGYWRFGYGLASGWGDSPTAQGFAGSVAGAAVFGSALTTAQVANEYGSRARTCADLGVSDGPQAYYRLSESAGTAAADASGSGSTGTYSSNGVAYGVAGPCSADGSTAVGLIGVVGVGLTADATVAHPGTLSTEVRFKTSTTSGGLLVGFYGSSTSYDFILYMRDDGGVSAGVWNSSPGASIVAASPAGTAYNNGAWHLADFTYSPGAGSTLYIDGVAVATNAAASVTDTYTGVWHVGYGRTTSWTGRPTSLGFAGSLAGAAIYTKVLTAAQVAAHAKGL